MFRAAHIQIHRHPVLFFGRVECGMLVARVDVAQVVPAGAGPLRHRVGLTTSSRPGDRIGVIEPRAGLRERRLAGPGGLEILHFGQRQRQIVLSHEACGTVLHVDHRERLAPVALAAEQPVAQLILDRGLADPARGQPLGGHALGLRDGHAVDVEAFGVRRADHASVSGPAGASGPHVSHGHAGGGGLGRVRLDDADDRDPEFLSKFKVARVVGRHGHDRARAVADQHVVGDPDGDLSAGHRIDRIRAGEDTGLLGVQFGAVHVALARGFFAVAVHVGPLRVGRDTRHQRMLGGEHHVGRAEQSVGACGVHRDPFAAARDGEINLRAFRLADPVALHLLDAFRPVQPVQIRQQALGILRDTQHPLAHRLADHRVVAALAAPVDHLFVREHRAQRRAPVHRHLGHIGQALLVKLLEDPLRPLVIAGVGGVHLAVPVIAEAQRLDLLAEPVDVAFGCDRRMRAGFHGILLGRQAERVPAHRMQHIETAHALVPAQDVRRRVSLGMADVQPRTARIRKHVEAIELGLARLKVIHLEGFVRLPIRLPFFFDRGEIILVCRHGRFPSVKKRKDSSMRAA
ncbi:MAG: hypothetical protein BWX70_02725 [Verrucomicrobia bacterium ADurb.Bin070]|nr:MAG: hypothetical protein BWX70_02725 [Verrucomicrobia bacterium ADurb.Bin070]